MKKNRSGKIIQTEQKKHLKREIKRLKAQAKRDQEEIIKLEEALGTVINSAWRNEDELGRRCTELERRYDNLSKLYHEEIEKNIRSQEFFGKLIKMVGGQYGKMDEF